jgi:hypothetical protein
MKGAPFYCGRHAEPGRQINTPEEVPLAEASTVRGRTHQPRVMSPRTVSPTLFVNVPYRGEPRTENTCVGLK